MSDELTYLVHVCVHDLPDAPAANRQKASERDACNMAHHREAQPVLGIKRSGVRAQQSGHVEHDVSHCASNSDKAIRHYASGIEIGEVRVNVDGVRDDKVNRHIRQKQGDLRQSRQHYGRNKKESLRSRRRERT